MSDLSDKLRDFDADFLATCPEIVEAADELDRLQSQLDSERERRALYEINLRGLNDTLTRVIGERDKATYRISELSQELFAAQSRLDKSETDLANLKGLMEALVNALRSGATSEEILAEIKGGLGLAPVVETSLPEGCHRSHPHEDMNAECERKTAELVRQREEGWDANGSPVE